MSTIDEVANLAGVSKATVSRVLSGSTPVREKTRLQVLAAVEKLNYSPSQAARSLASNKTYTVGLVTTNINTPYYGPAASGIETALRNHDRHVIIASGQNSLEGERDAVDFLIKRQVDALVLVTNFLTEKEIARINKRCPVFVMNQHFPGDRQQNIDYDNFAGGQMAIQYLLSKGHTRIAIVSGPRWKRDADQRYLGSIQAMKEARLKVHWQVEGSFGVADGASHMKTILQLKQKPTAVFFANDMMAIGALRVCHDQGIRVPKDMAIMGYDNWEHSKNFIPSLTTIHMPLYEMAEATALLVLNRVYGTQHKPKRQFQPSLITRESA
ncbi:LacI family DNA-binding transcriptional regulator [Gynuella sunshinyii]|uniref:Transcriptional regulator n=1 Tax=Gynuella sunshinyii YC6258 TaxID=1445510 RepID=A0A0C5V0V2_9GAMM|nr:LacI family DNA-binding transcriptional regulator [Gynuella sunshinyii]AJQ93160.1 transcriptional regulator [Gynuella sunshinyii YC6258]